MKNILFATVRQGNCGDEFILFGAQNIISSIVPEYNPVIVNKNVEVCRRLFFRNQIVDIHDHASDFKTSLNLEKLCFQNEPLHDDSFAEEYSLDFIDAVVIAGTPEWTTNKLRPLYTKLADFKGPVFFLGVGIHEGFQEIGNYTNIPEIFRTIHQKADVFVVRDHLLREYLKPDVKADLLPCPALMCAKDHQVRTRIQKIGFSLQAVAGRARVNSVPDETYNFSLRLLEAVSAKYEVEVVCHWIEDLICLQKDLGSRFSLRYSYDAKDYLNIYQPYDLVISTRVHGTGMAASLGIPGLTISHSLRTDTVKGFLSEIISPEDSMEDILTAIENLNIQSNSEKIIAHKQETLKAYKNKLAPYLQF